MPRRGRIVKREILPDGKHNSVIATKLMNRLMLRGQKATAERIVYDALQIIEQQERKAPATILEQAIKNVTPLLEVKPRRVGGATYQVPVEIRGPRRLALAIRWLIKGTRARRGRPMAERLAAELMDAAQGQGAAIKKREDTHRMAEANKAFAHYRW